MEDSQGWNDSTDVLQGIMVGREGHDSSDSKSSNFPFDSSANPLLDLQLGSLDPAQNNPASLSWSSTPQDLYFHQYPHSRLSSQDAWNPLLITGVPSTTSIPHMNTSTQMSDQHAYFSHHYTEPSETGSQYIENYHSADSGYDGRSCATQSVVASSYGVDSSSPPIRVNDNISSEPGSIFDHSQYRSGSCTVGSPAQSTDETMRCDHASCSWVGKCPSDKRKHEARHKKLFKCDVPNCARKEGFGTINDLARHKKCVHNEEPERGPKMMYMCFGTNCPRPNKRWPRLDNFKQHLNRMHNGEDGETLLKKSMNWYEKIIQEPLQSIDDQISRDGSVFEAQEEVASVQSTTKLEPDLTSVSQQKADRFTFGTATPKPLHYGTPSLAGTEPSQFPAFGYLGLSTSPDTSTRRSSTNSDGSVADAADNLINAMAKMMNNRGRKPSQTIDEGIDLESDNARLSQPQRQMLQKVFSAALERLSDEHEATVQVSDTEKRDWIQCNACSKRTRLRCEMKKHLKRHERPYGCTFPHCAKSFGSKADWKRHESSQHLDVQSWFCTEHDVGKKALCERLFYRPEPYAQHLRQHGLQEYQVTASVGNNRLDLADQPHFWCGFCNHRIKLNSCGPAARDERFNHIDAEHFKKGERGQDWRFPSPSFGGEQMARSEDVIHAAKTTDRRTATAGQRKRKFSMV